MKCAYSQRTIWTDIAKDIIEVKPMPRLASVLGSINTEHLIAAVVGIARRDTQFCKSTAALREIASIYAKGSSVDHVAFLPGGTHFVCSEDEYRQVSYHCISAQDISSGHVIWPSDAHQAPVRIAQVRAIQYTADTILLALLIAVG